jgi:hypothetical protein
MATEKKKSAPKKAKKTKKAAPKKAAPSIDPIIVKFCGVPEEEVNSLVLAAAHQALWGSNWRTAKEDAVLAAIQAERGQRRP